MSTLLTIRLAELDPNAVKAFPVRSLLGNSLTGDVYMIVQDGAQKKAVPIGGSAKYELDRHLQNAHLIQKYEPTTFDKSTVWFHNQLIYVEPTEATDAYITIQAETSPGSGRYEWKKILPISRADNIIVGKTHDNKPRTLASIIKDEGTRAVVKPTVEYEKAEKGEIHIKPDNSVWWKTGPDPADDILLANANEYVVDRLKQNIAIGENPPTHFDRNTMWVKDGGDAGIMNSMTSALYHTDPTLTTGLKLGKDFQDKGKLATVISDEGKMITIDLTATETYGHMITNYAFETNTKSYLELTIHDPEEKVALLLLKGGYTQPTQDGMYGTELSEDSILVTKSGSKFRNASTNKDMRLHSRTIFIMVDKTNTTANIKIGHVLDDGTLSYVYGSETAPGFTQNVANIGIASGTSNTPNSKAIVSIKSFKVKKIPTGYKGLNNVLPDETAFVNFAPLTNAQSVMLTNSQSLAELSAGGGRLITTPRSYTNRSVAKIHELLLDDEKKILWAVGKDMNLFPIGGSNDETFLKHLASSVQVTSQRATDVSYDPDDPSKVYVSKALPFNIKAPNDQRLIRGNFLVRDNSPEGDKRSYKLVVPYSDTLGSYHDWFDFSDGTTPKYTDLKTFLDEMYKIVRKFLLTDSIYSSFEEFGFDDNYLKANLASDTLYFREIFTNKMINESLYIESVNKIEPGSEATARQIDKIFNAPESGVAYVFKNRNGSLTISLNTAKGKYYTANMTSNFKITSWNQGILNIGTESEIPIDLRVKGKSYFEGDIESKGWSILNGGIWTESKNWFFTANNSNAGINNFNVMRYQGTKLNGDLSVVLGHNDNWDYIGLESKNKPYWLRKNSDGSYKKEYWILQEDIDRAWNYKGSLLVSGQPIDLNTLKSKEAVGYYTLSSSTSKKAKNHPEDNEKGFLEVAKDGNTIIQRYTSMGDGKVSIYTRMWDGSNWSDWRRTVNEVDLDLKYDKAGGEVSGDATFKKDFTVEKNAYLKGNVDIERNIRSTSSSVFGSVENLITLSKDNQNKKFVTLGTKNITSYDFNTTEVPSWVKPDNTKAKFALAEDLEEDKRNLANNYTDTEKLKEMLKKKVDTLTYDDEKKNFMKRDGDSATGNYSFSKGTTTFGDKSIINATNSTLRLPGKIVVNTVNDNKEEFAKTEFATGVYSYKTPNPSTPNSTVFSIKNENENTSYPSNFYFRLYNSGDLDFSSSNDNGTTVKDFKRFLFSDKIKNDFLGGEDFVSSAELSKKLYSNLVSRNRGNLSNFYSGTAFDIDKFYKLEPGNYVVSNDTDMAKLKLDTNKINKEGILISFGENGTLGKSFMYIPMKSESLGPNQVTNKVAFFNMKGKDTNAEWTYVADESLYYSKQETKELIEALREEIIPKFMSTRYSYTGNDKNLTLPYRLVHSHNQFNVPGIDNSKELTFVTNIDQALVAGSDGSLIVNIELKGYSSGTGYPIDIILTAHLGLSGGNLTITKKDEYHITPGAVVASCVVEGANLAFKINDAITNEGLSFDTYIRISKIKNPTFLPQVTVFKVDGSNKTINQYIFAKETLGTFSNS